MSAVAVISLLAMGTLAVFGQALGAEDWGDWETEWEETVAAAKEEGELVLVGGSAAVIYRPVFDKFEEKFDIRVRSSGGSSREIVDRILAERSAGRYTIDHFLVGLGTTIGRLLPNDVLIPIRNEFILPEVRDESLWFGGRHRFADPDNKYVFTHSAEAKVEDTNLRYNKNNVSEEEIENINSMWDFIDERWQAKIVGQPPNNPAATGTYNAVYWHPNLGPEWLEALFAMDITWMTDQRIIADQLLQGAFDVCLFCSGIADQLDRMRDHGAPIGDIMDKVEDDNWEDALTLTTTSSGNIINVVDHAAHPNAARVFVNWVLSKEGQTAMHVLTTDRQPSQSLRMDVTDMGNTNPYARRRVGRDYVFPSDVDGYDPRKSLEEVKRIKKSLEEARRSR